MRNAAANTPLVFDFSGFDRKFYEMTFNSPDADIPVLQMSMPTSDPYRLIELGRRLQPLRDEGVLVIGSGFMTHGLPYLRDWRTNSVAPTWSSEIETAPRELRRRATFITMLISSFCSISASLVLSIDAITLAKNPNSNLACNINAVISCGKVAVSWQSNLLGFPNTFLGLICEPVVITLAMAGLVGVRFP